MWRDCTWETGPCRSSLRWEEEEECLSATLVWVKGVQSMFRLGSMFGLG